LVRRADNVRHSSVTAAPISDFQGARAAVARGVSAEDAARPLVAAMTSEELLWCLDGDAPTWAGLAFLAEGGYHKAPFLAGRIERLGIPGFTFSDGPRGTVIGNACCFPVSMARGATWDPALEEAIGEAIGSELRASGATLTGAVCVNLLRHPAWGRAQETYGEDPFHVGEMGAALTRGLQRHVMACVKHFACNSIENARFSVDVEVDDTALHELYLRQFKRVVDEGVAAVMSAYNSVNGDWCGENHSLLTDILRSTWGFDGFVISDWIFGLRDAVKSLDAGLDVEMPYRMVRAEHLPAALHAGEASWEDVGRSAMRVVSTLLRFDNVLSQPSPDRDVIDSPAHRRLARLAAARSVVLLRNESVDGVPVLPLSLDDGPQVAVFGHLAHTVNLGDAGSSDVWTLESRTVVDGLRAALGPEQVTHHDGGALAEAASVAASADTAVIVVGYTYLDEGEYIGGEQSELLSLFPTRDDPEVVARFTAELATVLPTVTPAHVAARPDSVFSTGGDRTSLHLAAHDVDLVRAVADANPRTVVVLQGGSAVIVSEWEHRAAAIVHSFYGGCEAGTGLTDVLFGDIEPSGRLPFTIPQDHGQLPRFATLGGRIPYDRWHGWWHFRRCGYTPAYPFGFGLSYTTFALGPATGTRSQNTVKLEGSVTNTGNRAGTDVVQVYAELPDAEAPPRLVGFTRVAVAAGSEAALTIDVSLDALATWDPARHRWSPPQGMHRFFVSRHASDPEAQVVSLHI
jgi:beta-glucosidase